jgi:molybdopterin/thiamine biosynthesis adenylyltransferase
LTKRNRHRRQQNRPKEEKVTHKLFFVRAARAGREDLISRIPELSQLCKKTVTVVGLGCLGAPSVLELARCMVGEIRIIDFDIVETGTIVRWPFGLTAVGKHKTDVITDFIKKNYPYTKIVPFTHKIGGDPNPRERLDVLESALDNTDLVFDATAETGVQYLLSDLAAERNIPYIGISATVGNWGGMLFRIRPLVTEGCWLCFMHHLNDKSIPTPVADPTGLFQPIGCADPTFTGSGFDASIISLSGVRLSVSTLTAQQEKGYPSFDWDVAIVNLRDEQGKATVPTWKTFSLQRHPLCSCSKGV